MKLHTLRRDFYLTKKGDSLQSVCAAANVSERAVVKKNGLKSGEPLEEGIILLLPPAGNLYTVQAGDDVITLCGSKERFEELNGKTDLFPGEKVRM